MISNPISTRAKSIGFWGAYALLGIGLLFVLAPFIETKLFPVYSHFKPITATQTAEGVIATFSFTKHRNCAPRGLNWYLGEVGDSTSVDAQAPEGVRSPRPLGFQHSSPYLIEGIVLADIRNPDRLIARLRNQCDIPILDLLGIHVRLPWTTVSEVYP